MPAAVIAEALPRLVELAAQGHLQINTEPVSLADVAEVWTRKPDGRCTVLIS